jgi:hypothetical protein
MSVLRINKWESVFERAESRKIKTLTWIAWPVSFSSNGYQSLLDEFGDEAPAIYGVWCALCSVAASCSVRGVLATSRGIPLRLSHIARTTGFDVQLFERLVAWATRDEISWLAAISEAETAKLFADSDSETNENVGPTVSSGESPDVPGDGRGNPCTTRPDLTLPNHTKPIITRHHQTSGSHLPDATTPPVNDDPKDDEDDLGRRWKKPTTEFLILVGEIANRFGRLKDKIRIGTDGQKLDREYIWQLAWVGAEFGRANVDDVSERLATGEINKPRSYADSVMRNLCRQNGHEWLALRSLVPPVPPAKPARVDVVDDMEDVA